MQSLVQRDIFEAVGVLLRTAVRGLEFEEPCDTLNYGSSSAEPSLQLSFDVLTPAETYLSADELTDHFSDDGSSMTGISFVPRGQGILNDEPHRAIRRLYSRVSPEGVFQEHGPSDSYLDTSRKRVVLIARDFSGTLAAYGEFHFQLAPFADEVGSSPANLSFEESASFYLTVEVSKLYTLKAFRNQGAASAILHKVSEIFIGDIATFNENLHPVSHVTNLLFKATPCVYSAWQSQCDQLVHDRLVAAIENGAKEWHNHGFMEQGCLVVGELLPQGGYLD